MDNFAALISTWAAGGIADTNLTPAALVLRKANLVSVHYEVHIQYSPLIQAL